MSLVAKRKSPSSGRKRQAAHHKHNKHYLKAYTPYLPMLAIIGSGEIINEVWTAGTASASADPSSLSSTRLASLTGTHSYNLIYAVLAITFTAFLIFFLAHWWRIHRLLNRGEAYMVSHPWFDIGLVIVITAGVLLTRTNA